MNVLCLIPHVQERGGKKISRQRTYISGVSLAGSRGGGEGGGGARGYGAKVFAHEIEKKKKYGEE